MAVTYPSGKFVVSLPDAQSTAGMGSLENILDLYRWHRGEAALSGWSLSEIDGIVNEILAIVGKDIPWAVGSSDEWRRSFSQTFTMPLTGGEMRSGILFSAPLWPSVDWIERLNEWRRILSGLSPAAALWTAAHFDTSTLPSEPRRK